MTFESADNMRETSATTRETLGHSMASFFGDYNASLLLAQGPSHAELSWSELLWPACQRGLVRLACKYTRNSQKCEALVKATSEFRGMRATGQLLFALGIVTDARQMSKAIGRSVRSRNMRPAAAQATRSLTNWSAVWAGAELFGTGGALLGVGTGPGAVVTSGIGAFVGGYVGLFASEWIARRIYLAN